MTDCIPDVNGYLAANHPVLAMTLDDLRVLQAQGFTSILYADAKERWLVDLMTTDAPQCQGRLATCDGTAFCGLGRLEMVAPGVTLCVGRESFRRGGQDVAMFDEGGISRGTRKWAGLVDIAVTLRYGKIIGTDGVSLGENYASTWNDTEGKTFKEIAALVEKHVYAVTRPGLK